MNCSKYIISLLFLSTITPSLLYADLSLSTILNKKVHEEVVRKEYTIANDGVLSLENIKGSIVIKPEWNQTGLVISVKKRASGPEELKNIRMVSEQPTPSLIMVRTIHDGDEKMQATLDYEIFVPRHIKQLKLATRDGDISVSNVSGSIEAATYQGSITLENIMGAQATVKKQGAISVAHAQGSIHISTQKGAVKVINPAKEVFAISMKGSINVQSSKNLDNIWLKSGSGDIVLAMPRDVNADLQAKARGGKIVCEHEVTIKPFSTTLNEQAWARFKQEVSGVLGSKATDNKICLYAKNGSIKVVESKKMHRVQEMVS